MVPTIDSLLSRLSEDGPVESQQAAKQSCSITVPRQICSQSGGTICSTRAAAAAAAAA
jgi:hypothetical protein